MNIPMMLPGRESHAVTISPVDFDKNTDLILLTNQLIQDPSKRIQIFGAENRLYVHHKLGDLDFYAYWKGKFDKSYPILYKGKDLTKDPYVVDMSTIKHDGGGSQYTFFRSDLPRLCIDFTSGMGESRDSMERRCELFGGRYTGRIGFVALRI